MATQPIGLPATAMETASNVVVCYVRTGQDRWSVGGIFYGSSVEDELCAM